MESNSFPISMISYNDYLSYNDQDFVQYIEDLIRNDECPLEHFEIIMIEQIGYLFCELYKSNSGFDKITTLGNKMINTKYDNTIHDTKRIKIINIIITDILTINNDKIISDILYKLEHNVDKKFSQIYSLIVSEHDLKEYKLKYDITKNILRKIFDSQMDELISSSDISSETSTFITTATSTSPIISTNTSEFTQNISETMDEIKFSLGADCDILFNDDYPIPKRALQSETDSIFDALDLITQLIIIGCVELVKILLLESEKSMDVEYIGNLAKVAMRYNNYQCHHMLNHIIEHINSITNNDTNTYNDHPVIITTSISNIMNNINNMTNMTDMTNESDTPYVRMRDEDDDEATDNYHDYFEIDCLCMSLKICWNFNL